MKKLKNTLSMAMTAAFVLAFPSAAYAAGDYVNLEKTDASHVTVSVGMDNAYKEQITGVSLALKVNVEKGKEKFSFSFPDDLEDAVTGSRYANGYLTIYVAAPQGAFPNGIFDADDNLVLGELTADAATNAGLTAKISYKTGSFEVTNAAYSKKTVNLDQVPENVAISISGSGKPAETEPSKPDPTEPSKPDTSNPSEPGKPDTSNPSEPSKPNPSDPSKPDNGNTGGNTGGSGSSGSSSGSGGSSGSGKDRSGRSTTTTAAKIPSYVVKGTWTEKNGKWTFRGATGKDYKNEWAAVVNPYADTKAGQQAYDWFRFDENGNMMTGWVTDPDGNTYYLNPISDNTRGKMMTGWVWIPDANGIKHCYYFNPVSDGFRGKLLKNTTVEGYRVDANGVWTVNGVAQTKK